MNNQRNLFPRWENTPQGYGLVAIALHWVIAIMVLGLFSLGLWMTDLTYYHAGYKWAPEMHKGFGSLLFVLMVLRLTWRMANVSPQLERSIPPWQRRLAEWNHRTLYGLLFILMLSGYLISTADGRPLDVFGVIQVPATISTLPKQEDVAGLWHQYLAWILMGFILVHTLAALKHHFINRDRTLKKNALQRNE